MLSVISTIPNNLVTTIALLTATTVLFVNTKPSICDDCNAISWINVLPVTTRFEPLAFIPVSTLLLNSTLDALTNLNNRRQFETRLSQEIAITKRQENPLCAMMLDIDFFKKVNDTYGHAAGDEVLRTVAGIIKQALRESDIPARYGGEEFAVLLPFTHLEEAKIVGERLRKAVEEASITINEDTEDEKQINVTISMGIAEFDKLESGEALFERADKALYEAKTNGRNQVRTNN